MAGIEMELYSFLPSIQFKSQLNSKQ